MIIIGLVFIYFTIFLILLHYYTLFNMYKKKVVNDINFLVFFLLFREIQIFQWDNAMALVQVIL